LNRPKLWRFLKYFFMLLVSMGFVVLVLAVFFSFSIPLTIALFGLVIAISSIIAARDAGYVDLF
jgi:hypothetical protein